MQILGATDLTDIIRKNIEAFRSNPTLMKRVSYAAMMQAQKNARSKGGRRTWQDIARATHVDFCEPTRSRIVCNHVAGRQRHFGGPISARNKTYLTIPIAPEARSKTAADFANLFCVGKVLGQTRNDEFFPLFVLCKKTKPQRANPWWPDAAQLAPLVQREIDWKPTTGGVA